MTQRTSNSHPKPRTARQRRGAFTLIEILFVIALIAVLATVMIGNVGGIFGGQQEKVADLFVNQTAKLGLTPYRLDVGSYPSTEEGLEALMEPPPGKKEKWNGPYLEELPEDPWGNPYQYKFPGEKNINGARGYDIWSMGPDGKKSDDDIGNW